MTISILKPGDAAQYTDTVGSDCRFEAEWMKNTGLFVGETIGGAPCFREGQSVTKGEFLTMAVKSLGIPVDEKAVYNGYAEDVPNWLQPYLAAAMRAGLTAGLPVSETGALGLADTITGAEAAVMLQNAMDLSVSTYAEEENSDAPQWARYAVSAMNENGISVNAADSLNRGQVAVMLYQANLLAKQSPGLSMYQ